MVLMGHHWTGTGRWWCGGVRRRLRWGVFDVKTGLALAAARGALLDEARCVSRKAEVLQRECVPLLTEELRPPTVPIRSTATCRLLSPEQASSQEYWLERLVATDLEPTNALGANARRDGAGPEPEGWPSLGGGPAPSDRVHVISCGPSPSPVVPRILEALGGLWVAGVDVCWDAFYQGERRLRASLPTYPFERRRYWLGESAIARGDPVPNVASPDEPGVPRRRARPNLQVPYTEPREAIETALCESWAEAFGFDRVGVHDSFFDLGGDSLRAMQILVRVKQTFGCTLAVRDLLEAGTVAEFAAVIRDASGRAEVGGSAVIQRATPGLPAELMERLDELSEAEVDRLIREFSGNGDP